MDKYHRILSIIIEIPALENLILWVVRGELQDWGLSGERDLDIMARVPDYYYRFLLIISRALLLGNYYQVISLRALSA